MLSHCWNIGNNFSKVLKCFSQSPVLFAQIKSCNKFAIYNLLFKYLHICDFSLSLQKLAKSFSRSVTRTWYAVKVSKHEVGGVLLPHNRMFLTVVPFLYIFLFYYFSKMRPISNDLRNHYCSQRSNIMGTIQHLFNTCSTLVQWLFSQILEFPGECYLNRFLVYTFRYSAAHISPCESVLNMVLIGAFEIYIKNNAVNTFILKIQQSLLVELL